MKLGLGGGVVGRGLVVVVWIIFVKKDMYLLFFGVFGGLVIWYGDLVDCVIIFVLEYVGCVFCVL